MLIKQNKRKKMKGRWEKGFAPCLAQQIGALTSRNFPAMNSNLGLKIWTKNRKETADSETPAYFTGFPHFLFSISPFLTSKFSNENRTYSKLFHVLKPFHSISLAFNFPSSPILKTPKKVHNFQPLIFSLTTSSTHYFFSFFPFPTDLPSLFWIFFDFFRYWTSSHIGGEATIYRCKSGLESSDL